LGEALAMLLSMQARGVRADVVTYGRLDNRGDEHEEGGDAGRCHV
jgi:hypothetical protein